MQGSPRIDELRQKFHENPRRYFAPLANEYRKAGDPEQAIAICRAHLAQQPGHMSGHVVYGQALYDAHRVEEARVVFEKARTLDPDNAIVLRQLGDIAREKGEIAEARHWYTQALDADPQNSAVAAYIAEMTEPLDEGVIPPVEHEPEPVPMPLPVAVVETAPEPVPEPEPETDVEVPMPEPVREPEVIADEPDDVTIPVPDEEVPWRKTPPAEESPFVTRTMAELYASQGHRSAALDVFRQLAIQHPDDAEIRGRIDELSAEAAPAESVPEPAAATVLESAAEPPPQVVPHSVLEDVKEHTPVVEAAPVVLEQVPEVDHDLVIDPQPFADDEMVSDYAPPTPERPHDAVTAPVQEDEVTVDIEPPTENGVHFTDVELAATDWNSDAWTGGLSDESIDLSFESADVPQESERESETIESAPRTPEPATSQQQFPIAPPSSDEPWHVEISDLAEEPQEEAPMPTELHDHVPEDDPLSYLQPVEDEAAVEAPPTIAAPEVAPPVEHVEEPAPIEVAASVEEPVTVDEPDPVESEDEPHFVAYSPQPPEDDELPHFAPKGPTVREFFATLGAKLPPSIAPGTSFTARAVVPAVDPVFESPVAAPPDTLATLFPDATVAEEDSRAAFALSGALGAGEHGTRVEPAAPVSSPAPQTPSAGTAQESEEDIRRFREWLDGLAES